MNVSVDAINESRWCRTTLCKGNLEQTSVLTKGKGGAIEATFQCNGCTKKKKCASSPVKKIGYNPCTDGYICCIGFYVYRYPQSACIGARCCCNNWKKHLQRHSAKVCSCDRTAGGATGRSETVYESVESRRQWVMVMGSNLQWWGVADPRTLQ